MKTIHICMATCLALLALCGCANDDPATHDLSAPIVVDHVYPTSGGAGSEVIITGENFSTDPTQITVKVGNTPVTVLNSDMNNIVVIIPKKMGSGQFEISIAGREPVASPETFAYTYSATVSTLAGTGEAGYREGLASEAQFHFSDSDAGGWRKGAICVDGEKNVYVSDIMNYCIRKITPDGEVSNVIGSPGSIGTDDGTGNSARINSVYGMDCDAEGNIWLADVSSWGLRKITGRTVVTVGSCPCEPWYVSIDRANGYLYVSSQGGRAIYRCALPKDGETPSFEAVATGETYSGVAVAPDGSIYVGNVDTHQINRFVRNGSEWTKEIIAGTGTAGYVNDSFEMAQFSWPRGMEFDGAGDLFVAGNGTWDGGVNADQSIRRLNMADRTVSTVAGSGTAGYVDGSGVAAAFSGPQDLAIDDDGVIYVFDKMNNVVRKIIFE